MSFDISSSLLPPRKKLDVLSGAFGHHRRGLRVARHIEGIGGVGQGPGPTVVRQVVLLLVATRKGGAVCTNRTGRHLRAADGATAGYTEVDVVH